MILIHVRYISSYDLIRSHSYRTPTIFKTLPGLSVFVSFSSGSWFPVTWGTLTKGSFFLGIVGFWAILFAIIFYFTFSLFFFSHFPFISFSHFPFLFFTPFKKNSLFLLKNTSLLIIAIQLHFCLAVCFDSVIKISFSGGLFGILFWGDLDPVFPQCFSIFKLTSGAPYLDSKGNLLRGLLPPSLLRRRPIWAMTIDKVTFSKVRWPWHILTEKEVAVKIIHKSQHNFLGLQTLYHKVKIMKVLDHPNIMKLSEAMDMEETLCFVVECAGGGMLHQPRDHGSTKEKQASGNFCQRMSTRQYCSWTIHPGCWLEHQGGRLWLQSQIHLWQ